MSIFVPVFITRKGGYSMGYRFLGGLKFFAEKSGISVCSIQIASFFTIKHVKVCKTIEGKKDKIGAWFLPSFLNDGLTYKKILLWYDVNKQGCDFLLDNLDVHKEDKKNFLNIIDMAQ